MEKDTFLNPEPFNLTLCQTLNPAEHQQARHAAVTIYYLKGIILERYLGKFYIFYYRENNYLLFLQLDLKIFQKVIRSNIFHYKFQCKT